MENRRRAIRKPLVSPIVIQTVALRKKIADGFITNINEGGIAIVSPKELPVGDKLLFNIDMPNGWRFDLFGKIVNARHGPALNAYNATFDPGQATFIFNLF
jgi:hypothetical protein